MGNSIRVLHVADGGEFTEGAIRYLEREHEDVTVRTERTPDDALARLRAERVDCVVSDYRLPGGDGLSFLDSVRDGHPDLPFVLLAREGSEEIASEAISRGVTEYVPKDDGTDGYATLATRVREAVTQYRTDAGVETTRAFFRTLVEESTDIVMVVDAAGTIQYVTPSAERILGRTPEELIGTDPFDPIHPEDTDRVIKRFGEMIEDPGERASVEFRYERGDGEWIWAEARGRNLIEDPRVEGAVIYTRDVTERRERERELRQEQAFTEATLESVADAYWVIDPEGYVTRWSDDDGSVTGYASEEAIGTHSSVFHPEEHVPRIQEAIEEMKSEGTTEVEADLQRKGGERVPYLFTGTALTDDDGRIESMCGLGRDISDRKRREAELKRQNERLEEFVGMVSHDLRNPINVLQGRLDLAEETGDSEQFDRCREALRRMDELIDDLLALGRLGQPVEPEEVGPVDLDAVVGRCWEAVRTPGATVEAGSDLVIVADRGRLRRLFENLFRNAVEHSSTSPPASREDAVEHGGTGVAVTVGALPGGFFVEDDGPGIPAEERESVFERGYSTSDDGSGIGLSIVREVAEAHGWELEIVEGSEGGARFEITGVEHA